MELDVQSGTSSAVLRCQCWLSHPKTHLFLFSFHLFEIVKSL